MLTTTRFFVNRIEEIDQLNLLLGSEAPEKDFLVLMYGQHGIGKTEVLVKYLTLVSQRDNLRIAYVDLRNRDYMGLIEEMVEGLGKTGFEDLYKTLDAIFSQLQVDQLALERLREQLHLGGPPSLTEGSGITFNEGASAGRDMYFVNGPANFVDSRFEYIINIDSREPEKVEEFHQNRITLAFQSCLMSITQTQPVVLLLDHWDDANDYLKIWLNDHLLKWASQWKLKKALLVLCQIALPESMEDMQGILPLAIPPFSREIALEFWKKNGLPEEEFSAIGSQIFSIPSVLQVEVGKRRFNRPKQ